MSTWRSGEEMAVDVGRIGAVSSTLHKILGAGAQLSSLPSVTVLCDEWSLEAAEHSEWLTDRLPFRADFDRASFLHVGNYSEALATVRAWSEAGDDLAFFAGIVEVILQTLHDDVVGIAGRTSKAGDQNLLRRLGFIQSDLARALSEGRVPLARLTKDAENRAHLAQALESLPPIRLF